MIVMIINKRRIGIYALRPVIIMFYSSFAHCSTGCFQVLRIMKYIVLNGHLQFRQHLRKTSQGIVEATSMYSFNVIHLKELLIIKLFCTDIVGARQCKLL